MSRNSEPQGSHGRSWQAPPLRLIDATDRRGRTGKPDSNSYATVAQADAYHALRNNAAWCIERLRLDRIELFAARRRTRFLRSPQVPGTIDLPQ